MRRIGTELWAGIAMLVVSVAVATPALLGVAPTRIARVWWVALFILFLVALVTATATSTVRGPVRYIAFAVAVGTVWALVLTAPGMGLLLILLVVTATTSIYIVPLWAGILTVLANTGVIAVVTFSLETSTGEALMLTGFYLLIQFASLFSTATLIREQALRRQIAAAHVDLQAASILLSESARTEERLRISRELHDLIGHQLTVLTLELETARHTGPDAVAEHIDRADGVARDLLQNVRQTVGHLRTQAPDLEGSLQDIADAAPGLDVSIDVAPNLRLEEEHGAALVRAVQEIVTNTLRHAEARTLYIQIRERDGGITLSARDDGLGAGRVVMGNGLRGLMERFVNLGGELTVDGHDGFRIEGRIPAS